MACALWWSHRCDELLLFTCCPEGQALEGRRRQLARLPVTELKAQCQHVGAKIGGAKYLMVERLLGHEFGPAAAQREAALSGQAKCRERAGLGCGGCRACGGEGRAGWVHVSVAECNAIEKEDQPPPVSLTRRRRADEQPGPVPPHERCILFNGGPESAEWGPPAYMHDYYMGRQIQNH